MRATIPCMALLAAAVGGAGCFISTEPELRITELRVTGEWDQWGALEIEVHMFDADTRAYLGCSGQLEGLEHVDDSDVTYRLDAWFREPFDDVELEPWVLDNRRVELQVTEDDDVGCPEAPSIDDDVLGISGPVDRAMVEVGSSLAFDRVVSLGLAID